MRSVQVLVERIILGSRYILAVVYLGLVAALVLFAAQYLYKLVSIARQFPAEDYNAVLIAVLELIDKALVAGLVFTVVVASYDNLVSRLGEGDQDRRVKWLGKLDAGSLKVKVASAVAAISLIHLLQIHLNSERYTGDQIFWKVVVHITLITTAVSLGFLDRLTEKPKDKEGGID